MARYRKISLQLWSDEKFRRLSQPQPCGRYLWLQLIAGPFTTNIPGCIPHSPEVIGASLGWGKRFREPFGELFREGLLKADEGAGLIWLPKALEHNPPDNPNVVKGWAATWPEIPECPLKREINGAILLFLERLGEPFVEPFPKPFPKPCRNGSDIQEQEQEQEQYTEANNEIRTPDEWAEGAGADRLVPTKRRKPTLLERWQVECARIWAYQEELRKRAIPGTRKLLASDERLIRIARLLEGGATEDECRHVLEVYAADATKGPEVSKWFNGVTHWRPDNFDRALGRRVSDTSRPKEPPLLDLRYEAERIAQYGGDK